METQDFPLEAGVALTTLALPCSRDASTFNYCTSQFTLFVRKISYLKFICLYCVCVFIYHTDVDVFKIRRVLNGAHERNDLQISIKNGKPCLRLLVVFKNDSLIIIYPP